MHFIFRLKSEVSGNFKPFLIICQKHSREYDYASMKIAKDGMNRSLYLATDTNRREVVYSNVLPHTTLLFKHFCIREWGGQKRGTRPE